MGRRDILESCGLTNHRKAATGLKRYYTLFVIHRVSMGVQKGPPCCFCDYFSGVRRREAMVLIVGSAVAPYQIPFTIFHELSGLNALIDAAFPLSSPRSFSYTTPS